MKSPLRQIWFQSLAVTASLIVFSSISVFGQAPQPVPEESGKAQQQNLDKRNSSATTTPSGTNTKKTAKEPAGKIISDEDRQILRREDASEAEADFLPYINNFFATTRLGPEDVISVDVFDQPIYSRSNLPVPPNGRINYPLIGQILVAGRTTEEIEKDISKKLAEYIIDPKVTVQINQVHSLKFMAIGEVVSPGIYEMTRRMSMSEGLARAGYFNKYGKRDNVSLLRLQPNGQPKVIKVNMKDVEKGKAEDLYLVPGDTIFVPSNLWKPIDQVVGLVSLIAWMRVIANE